eukprot:CAMPEP_0179186236 /NCGR_PEP_ID=MMETSP0796-20121207/92362_1 /TAXON_ID=73915 /ORGANISM="Pyrodinium bahamense, Strain pbaha01" /LENGTH=202 /DNA_ID=CAMNT_0020890213 /DNA_START=28 /DNA_END=633 /DNA_ORIENTATION=+
MAAFSTEIIDGSPNPIQLALPSAVFCRESADASMQQEGIPHQIRKRSFDASPPDTRVGHVWFNTPMNSSVDITPYSQVYGLHPRFFHFDGSGSMQLTPVAVESSSPSLPRSSHGSFRVPPGSLGGQACGSSPGTPMRTPRGSVAVLSAPGTPCRGVSMSASYSPAALPASTTSVAYSGSSTPGCPQAPASHVGRLPSMPVSW